MNAFTRSVASQVLLSLTVLAVVFTDTASADSTQARPNVLFIAIDDLRPALGCYGDPLAKSPNIDRFATSARRFNRAYVQQAVCGPSRTSLLTGLLPDHTRVWHNRNRFREEHPDHVTLPQLFKQNGYQTLGCGKLFSGNEKELDPVSWSRPETLRLKGWKNYLLEINQGKEKKQSAFEAADVDDGAYPDGKLATLAVETLENLNQDGKPFFLAIGFFKPHLPFNAPKKYWDLHNPLAFELPDSLRDPVRLSPDIALHSHRELGGYKGVPKNEKLNLEQSRILRHGYYACVSYVDAQVGKVLDALTRLDLDQNTIVVLWGDHGFSLGESGRWCKGTNFELDTRVPLLIRAPRLAHPGIATDSLVEMVDLYPTLAELADLEAPAELDGRSFKSLLDNPRAAGRDTALSQFNRPWESSTPKVMGYSIRSKQERYTRWINWQSRETIAEELYDYSSPPNTRLPSTQHFERKNLIRDQPERLDRMRNKLNAVLVERGLTNERRKNPRRILSGSEAADQNKDTTENP